MCIICYASEQQSNMLKNVFLSKILKVIPILILVAVFGCVLHITPQISHNLSDSHSEESASQVTCVDQQVSRLCSTRDHVAAMFVATLPPHFTVSTQNLFLASVSYYDTGQYSPYTKEYLYIKNNTFLI